MNLKAALRKLILGIIWIVAAVFGPLIRRLRHPGGLQPPRDNFLLIRLDLLGDVVFSLASARALKSARPEARVTMVTLPQTAPVARLSPFIDRVITLDTNAIRTPVGLFNFAVVGAILHAVREIGDTSFEAVLSLSGRTASLLAAVARSKRRLGYDDEAYPGTLDVRVNDGRWQPSSRIHDGDACLNLIQSSGIAGDSPTYGPLLKVDPAAADTLFLEHGIDRRKPIVAMHIGSGYGDYKRWPADRFTALAHALLTRDVQSVIVGGPADVELAERIAFNSEATSLAGKTDMRQLLAILSCATVMVSGDSGPLHLATAIGTPVVGLYGPTDPDVNGPRAWQGQAVSVVRADIPCSPCYSVARRAECPLGHPICMDLITVESVVAEVMKIVGSSSRR